MRDYIDLTNEQAEILESIDSKEAAETALPRLKELLNKAKEVELARGQTEDQRALNSKDRIAGREDSGRIEQGNAAKVRCNGQNLYPSFRALALGRSPIRRKQTVSSSTDEANNLPGV